MRANKYAPDVLASIRHRLPWLRQVFADGGYAGDKLRVALTKVGKWVREIVKQSDRAKGPSTSHGQG